MRIFEIKANCESYFVLANTIPEALIELKELEDIEIEDFTRDDTITEIPESEWGNHKVQYHEPEEFEVTFKEHVKGLTKAEVFASSAWYE